MCTHTSTGAAGDGVGRTELRRGVSGVSVRCDGGRVRGGDGDGCCV